MSFCKKLLISFQAVVVWFTLLMMYARAFLVASTDNFLIKLSPKRKCDKIELNMIKLCRFDSVLRINRHTSVWSFAKNRREKKINEYVFMKLQFCTVSWKICKKLTQWNCKCVSAVARKKGSNSTNSDIYSYNAPTKIMSIRWTSIIWKYKEKIFRFDE